MFHAGACRPKDAELPAVVAVAPDLYFAAKISAVARAAGVEVTFETPARVTATCASQPPALLLFDLHATDDPAALVHALKSDPVSRAVRIVGFYSHVDTALRRAVLAAGIDEALPRSVFEARLASLLQRAGSPAGEPPAAP
ncbi:MAG TPA: hypothetical protein VMH61_00535 [Candidatus Acidoferrales bacterium]|nr:hypothetical protein [Candidatus Acidoferrales bacterium]